MCYHAILERILPKKIQVFVQNFIFAIFCRFVDKNATKFICYVDLLKVTKLTRLVQTKPSQIPILSFDPEHYKTKHTNLEL